MIHPEDNERIWAEIQTALREKRTFELSYRIITATGGEKWVWEKGSGIYDESGALQALEGLIIDVTERKKAEGRILRLTRLYSVLSKVNETIVRTHAPEELYRQVC